MASRNPLCFTEPHDSLSHVVKIFTRIGHHQITRIHACQFIRVLRSQIGSSALRMNAILCEDMAVMNSRNTFIDKKLLRHPATTLQIGNLSQGSIFHPVRAQLRNQLSEAAHRSASSSATIASMEARSSRWRSTMPAIRVFSSTMSTCSRVSSGST